MLFVILCLIISFILFLLYSRILHKAKILKALFIIFFCFSIFLSTFLFFQDIYISNNYMEVNTLVTFDEEGYPTSHLVNLHQNISTKKIYAIKKRLGFYILDEVTLENGVEPIVTDTEHSATHFGDIPLYTYTNS